MINTLQVLRQAGFFKDYAQLNNEELLETIHKNRKQAYSKIFDYDYELEKFMDDHKLATQDTTKMLYMDLEANVCKGNKVYADLLRTLDQMSGEGGLITGIEEVWEGEAGPITVKCKINGAVKQYHPEYSDDWIDPVIFEIMLADVSAVIGEEFQMCLGPNFEWFGQDVNYIRLTPEEKQVLQKKLNWKFKDEFSNEEDNR